MSPEERQLWARHLGLKRAINGAYFRRRIKEAQKLEEELRALEDQIFSRWRKPKSPPAPPERFSYRIPVRDGETGRALGYKIADQDGVHDLANGSASGPDDVGELDPVRAERWSRALAAVDAHALECKECNTKRPRDGRDNRRYEPYAPCPKARRLEVEERRARESAQRSARRDRGLPANESGREWLKQIEPSKEARDRAARTWHALEHVGRPRCPGCRKRKEIVYLEFRNWNEEARFKIPHVMAVCDEAARGLLELARRSVFGVTALGRRVSWSCRAPITQTVRRAERAPSPPVRLETRRGRHPRSLANLIPNARHRKAKTA